MATAVLRSQDCLRDRFPRETLTSFPSSSSSLFQSKHGRNPNRTTRSGGRRKRSPSDSESDRLSPTTSMVVKLPAKNLVMGQVKILKRGEEIVNNTKNEEKSRSEEIVNNTKNNEEKTRSEVILSNMKKVEKSRSEKILNNAKKEGKRNSDVERKVVEIAEKLKLEVTVVSSSDRLGPEPEMIPKEVRLTDLKSVNGETFAGSVFVSSPSPNSLPFPTFTKQVVATKDLRRILGINLL
ncbi:hypothetical protein FRX31_022701 [Thalictrum thalictroides]|uniref:Uncharacterized protein n=1 Tax=Thalictrum thalictroides TaxID=46969 RepID=A0A7J6VRK6_THATH|nr:hypothetical protein FRX31_022701 [Thalictrum thalictroides]